MSPPRTIRLNPNPLAAAWKELRRMPRNLIRFLDTMSHVTVVFLALYVAVSVATVGLGA
jgi:hypothetical protein